VAWKYAWVAVAAVCLAGCGGPAPANTKLSVPQTGIAFLHGIPAIGTKFDKSETLGPESQKNTASGTYRGTVWFHFD
jgi:hypothetical protein